MPVIQAIPTLSGGAQTAPHSALGMSLSGRYVLLPDNTSVRDMTLRDFKTQKTTAFPIKVPFMSDHYAISPNGRYVSYPFINSAGQTQGMVFDRVTQNVVQIRVRDETRALSDYGLVALRDQINSAGVQLFNTRTGVTEVISAGGSMNIATVRNDLSSDGLITMYYEAGSMRLYNAALKQSFIFKPLASNGAPLPVPMIGSNIGISSSGKYIAFKSDDINDPNHRFLYRANLTVGTAHTLDRFDVGAKFVSVLGSVSISRDGRFMSFRGNLLPGHAEYAAVEAAGLTDPVRIFRYDALLNVLQTVSVARDGGPLRNRFDLQSPGSARVADSTRISDDGSMVSFATDADNIVTLTPTTSFGMQNYHAYLGNGFARNHLFVDLPNTDNGWKPMAPMMLVADHQWEGKLTFDGVGAESFKFDVGGRILNGQMLPTADWAINFGTGATPGVASANGGNIPLPGAGTYDISFNDQTLAYSINPASEFRLQHVGGRCVEGSGAALNPANDTPLIFGSSCVNQPQRRFRLLPNKSLQQVSSGLCVHPRGGSITPALGTPLVLWSQCDDGPGNKKLAFEFTAGGSIRHINSGLCIHPSGGSATPALGTQLVLWNICDQPRLGISKR